MSSVDRPVSSKRAGENAEAAILEAVPELESVPDRDVEHYDARADDLLEPRSSLPFVGLCLLEVGSVVEIKSAIPRLASGKRGMFYLREQQHRRLVEAAGSYLFAVCEPRPAREPVAMKIVPATIVDDVVSGWRSAGVDRPQCCQLSWSRIFDASEVSR